MTLVSKLKSEELISQLSGWYFLANGIYAILALRFDEPGSISSISKSFLILKLRQVFWVLVGGVLRGDGEWGKEDFGGGDWKVCGAGGGGELGGGGDSGILPFHSGE